MPTEGVTEESTKIASAIKPKLSPIQSINKTDAKPSSTLAELSEEKLVRDELPEFSVNTQHELRQFLSTYRTAMTEVLNDQLGFKYDSDPSTRCGLTAALIIRALYEKPNVVGLQRLSVRRASFKSFYPDDEYGMDLVQGAIQQIAVETGKSTEVVRETLLDLGYVANWWHDIRETGEDITLQDGRIQQYLEETVVELPDSHPDVVQKSWAFYESLSQSHPDAIKSVVDYLESGWGHTVVLIDIQFKGKPSPRRFIIDANSEQFGDTFDRLYLFPIESAAKNGYTTKDQNLPITKIDPGKISGTVEKLINLDDSPDSYHIIRQDVPIEEVSRMLAKEFRKLFKSL